MRLYVALLLQIDLVENETCANRLVEAEQLVLNLLGYDKFLLEVVLTIKSAFKRFLLLPGGRR